MQISYLSLSILNSINSKPEKPFAKILGVQLFLCVYACSRARLYVSKILSSILCLYRNHVHIAHSVWLCHVYLKYIRLIGDIFKIMSTARGEKSMNISSDMIGEGKVKKLIDGRCMCAHVYGMIYISSTCSTRVWLLSNIAISKRHSRTLPSIPSLSL